MLKWQVIWDKKTNDLSKIDYLLEELDEISKKGIKKKDTEKFLKKRFSVSFFLSYASNESKSVLA